MNTFYAYVHARPDASIFYVGKGTGKRAYRLRGRSSYHQNVINKHGAENILIGKMECSSEEAAFELEKGLIKCLRRMGCELTNKTDGGDGVSGMVHTAETKQKLSNLFKDPDFVERHSSSVKAAHVRSKELYRASAKESQNRSEVLAKHKEYQGSTEVREAKSKWGRAAWADKDRSLEWRAKLVAANKTPEARAAKSASLKGKNANRIYIFKDQVVRAVMLNELDAFLLDGWAKGNPKSRGRIVTRGRVWANNGEVNKMIFLSDFGSLKYSTWKRGRK